MTEREREELEREISVLIEPSPRSEKFGTFCSSDGDAWHSLGSRMEWVPRRWAKDPASAFLLMLKVRATAGWGIDATGPVCVAVIKAEPGIREEGGDWLEAFALAAREWLRRGSVAIRG